MGYYNSVDLRSALRSETTFKTPSIEIRKAGLTDYKSIHNDVVKSHIIDSLYSNQKLLLKNQKISLHNDARMLDLLASKEMQVKELTTDKNHFKELAKVSEEVRTNSIVQNTFEQYARTMLTAIAIAIGFLILSVGLLTYKVSKINKRQENDGKG